MLNFMHFQHSCQKCTEYMLQGKKWNAIKNDYKYSRSSPFDIKNAIY